MVGDCVVGDTGVGVAAVSAAVINVLGEPGARNVKVAFHFNAQAVVTSQLVCNTTVYSVHMHD